MASKVNSKKIIEKHLDEESDAEIEEQDSEVEIKYWEL
jgi:hypothetical protein